MSNISKLIMLLAIGLVIAGCSIYLIGGKKQLFHAEVVIKAPVGQIFPYVVQPDLKRLWIKGLIEQQLTEGDEIGEGSFLKSTVQSNGKTESFDDEVIRYYDNEIVSIKSKNPRLSSTMMVKLKEEGSGTRVTYKRIVQYKGIERFKTIFADSQDQQELEKDLNELARLIENNVADPGSSATSGNGASTETEDSTEQTKPGAFPNG